MPKNKFTDKELMKFADGELKGGVILVKEKL
jgi:hypothetical protein